jgi:predicted kinase
MKFIFSVGCSGSGKSTYYYKNLKDTFEIVEPDLIRKEMGDINDQSRNGEVYMTAHKRLDKYLNEGKNVYFSATNLNLKSIKDIVDIAKEYTDDITCIQFNDSYVWELCQDRVKKDLSNGVDRSNTDVMKELPTGEKIPLVKEMSDRFTKLVNSQEFSDLIEEQGIKLIEV